MKHEKAQRKCESRYKPKTEQKVNQWRGTSVRKCAMHLPTITKKNFREKYKRTVSALKELNGIFLLLRYFG